MDPSFTRLIKLDILTALALEPKAVNAVLSELRTYISHEDKSFVCASVQAVGRIAEISRIVYSREAERSGGDLSTARKARSTSDEIVLNCLHGLITLTECSENAIVVQECVIVIQLILSLFSLSVVGEKNAHTMEDPNNIQIMAVHKLVLLVIRSLTNILEKSDGGSDESEGRLHGDQDYVTLNDRTIILPSKAIAPAIWVISEWFAKSLPLTLSTVSIRDQRTSLLFEIMRLLAATFIYLDPCLKIHSVHFASKTLFQHHKSNSDVTILCEYILSLGRVDSNTDVRDRARNESNLLHMCLGLTFDTETLGLSLSLGGKENIPLPTAEAMLLGNKPAPSWLPIDAHGDELPHVFRFGTLSNMVSHKAGPMYVQLPPWAETDSSSSLRAPPQQAKINELQTTKLLDPRVPRGDTYSDSDESSSDASSAEESSSEDETSSDESADSSYTSNDTDSSTSSGDNESHDPLPSVNLINGNSVIEASAKMLDLSCNLSISSSPHQYARSSGMNRLEESVPKKQSLVEELDGLVMTPLILQSSVTDTNCAIWIPLLRYEITGGLSVMLRSVRGDNRHRIIKSAGLNEVHTAVLCFDLKLENK